MAFMDAERSTDRVIAAAFLRSDADLDLAQIGKVLGCSSATASRLLAEAQRLQWLHERWEMDLSALSEDERRRCLHLLRDAEMEQRIVSTWRSCDNCVVVKTEALAALGPGAGGEAGEPDRHSLASTVRAAVGRAAAFLFTKELVQQLPERSWIALAWGGMTASFVVGLRTFRPVLKSATIVPVIGHVQSEDGHDADSAQALCRRMAQTTGAKPLVLSIPSRIPLAVEDLQVATETLKGDARFKELFTPRDKEGCTPLATKADCLIMGIGSLEGGRWPHLADVADLTEGFVSRLENAELRAATQRDLEARHDEAGKLEVIHSLLRKRILVEEGILGDILSNWVRLEGDRLVEPADGWAAKFNARMNGLHLQDVAKIAEEARSRKTPGVMVVSCGYPEPENREKILRHALESRLISNLVIDSYLARALLAPMG